MTVGIKTGQASSFLSHCNLDRKKQVENTQADEYCINPVHDENLCNQFMSLGVPSNLNIMESFQIIE